MEKILIFLHFLALCSQINAQCQKYVQSATDKMTGKEYIVSKPLIVSSDKRTGLRFTPYLSEERIMLDFKFVGENCIDNSNSIYILFTDQTRLQLKNHTSFNCNNQGIIYFSRSNRNLAELKELTEKKIETIRVYTYKSYVQSDFTLNQANLFQRTMFCLMESGGEHFVTFDEPPLPEPEIIAELGSLNNEAIKLVRPVYPDEARKVGAKGTVLVQVIIDEEGKVIYAKAVTGHNTLHVSAENAAKASLFKPKLITGQNVKGKGDILYHFSGQ